MALTEPRRLGLTVAAILGLALVILVAVVIFAIQPAPAPAPGATVRPAPAAFVVRNVAMGPAQIGGEEGVELPFIRPSTVAISPEGYLVVSSRAGKDQVTGRQSPNGLFLFELSDPSKRQVDGNLRFVNAFLPDCSVGGLAFDEPRQSLYVSCRDEEGAGYNRVYSYAWEDVRNRSALRENAPRHSLAAGTGERMVVKDGKLYVATDESEKVEILEPPTWRAVGAITSPRQFITRALAFDGSGNLVVGTADQEQDIVQVFGPSGQYLRSLDDALFARTVTKAMVGGETVSDMDIAVTRDGRLLFAYASANALLVLGSDYGLVKRVTGAPDEPFDLPRSVAIDAQNRVFVVDARHNSIKAFDADRDFAYLGRFP